MSLGVHRALAIAMACLLWFGSGSMADLLPSSPVVWQVGMGVLSGLGLAAGFALVWVQVLLARQARDVPEA